MTLSESPVFAAALLSEEDVLPPQAVRADRHSAPARIAAMDFFMEIRSFSDIYHNFMITELTIALVQMMRKAHADLLEDLHDDNDDDDGDEHDDAAHSGGSLLHQMALGAVGAHLLADVARLQKADPAGMSTMVITMRWPRRGRS